MNAEDLMNKYPHILKTYPSCGKGWYWLLDQLFSMIDHDIKYNNDNDTIEITDIKEKYGSLSITAYGASKTQFNLIRYTEHLSYHMCEECGTIHNIGHTKTWIKTLCSNCYNNTTRHYISWTPELFDEDLQ